MLFGEVRSVSALPAELAPCRRQGKDPGGQALVVWQGAVQSRLQRH